MPHIVSAFASKNGLCLGQATVDQKCNEITAIPLFLELIAIEGCTVTIDAMGCQSDISGKIIENGADYILAVKGNQQGLEQSIRETVMLPPLMRQILRKTAGITGLKKGHVQSIPS